MRAKGTIKNVEKLGRKSRKQMKQLRNNAANARAAKQAYNVKLNQDDLAKLDDSLATTKAKVFAMDNIKKNALVPKPCTPSYSSLYESVKAGSMFMRFGSRKSSVDSVDISMTSEENNVALPVIRRAPRKIIKEWAKKFNTTPEQIRKLRKQYFRHMSRQRQHIEKKLDKMRSFYRWWKDHKKFLREAIKDVTAYKHRRLALTKARYTTSMKDRYYNGTGAWEAYKHQIQAQEKKPRRKYNWRKPTNIKKYYRINRRNFVMNRIGEVMSSWEYKRECLH